MRDDELTPNQREARDELHDLIQKRAREFGPEFDGQAEGYDAGKMTFLDSWVVMAEWTGANGESFLTRLTSKDLRVSSRVGLLHEGLYGFDDGDS